MLNPRNIFIAVFLACAGLLVTAIFIEPFKSMNPCPMCIMQRVFFMIVGAIALVAALHNAKRIGLRVYAGLCTVFSLAGAGVAARQVWLQHLPEDQVPACGPGLEYMLEVFPLFEALEMAFRGTGDCAEVQWTFLGLSIPGWSFLAFIGFAGAGVWMLMSTFKAQKVNQQ